MPPVFWVFLREGYDLPKWFLLWWGMFFVFAAELFHLSPKGRGMGEGELIFPVFVYPWLAFFFFSLLSLGAVVNFPLGFLNIANLILGFSILFFVSNRWDELEVKSLIPFLVLPALPVAVYGIFQAFGCDFISYAGSFKGAISTFGHRNFVAEYELMVLPLLIYLGFFHTAAEKSISKNVVRGFSLASLPIVYAHLIMTHTRGSYVALIAALLFMLVIWLGLPRRKMPRNDRFFVGTAVLLLLLTGLFLAHNFDRSGEKVIGQGAGEVRQNSAVAGGGEEAQNGVEIPASLHSRILIWQATFAVFRKHPVVGVGAGNLNEVLPPYYSPELLKMFQGKVEAGTSHDEYLQILAETGLPGAFSFLAFLVFLLYFGTRVGRRPAKDKNEYLPFFLTASILGILTAALVSSPLQRPETLFLFGLFIGFLAVFGKEGTRSFTVNRKVQERIWLGFTVVLGLCAYNFGWLPLRADFYGQKSYHEFRSGYHKQAVADIEQALRFQPQSRYLLTLAGNTYLNINRFEDAARIYGQAVVYHPYWPGGYGNLGIALAQAGLFADAEKCLNYSLQLDPYQPLVHNTLGTVYLQQGRRPEAKEEFLKALAIDPGLIFPRLNLQEMEKNQIK